MSTTTVSTTQPVLQGRGLVKTFGRVVALNGADLELYPGEVLAVVGDNGAGKSSLIKCFSGAHVPDGGDMLVDNEVVSFRSTHEARLAGIETVFQTLAVAPALDISENLFLGREVRSPGILGTVFRKLDTKWMRAESARHLKELGIGTVQSITQTV
ncbi:MAG: hypothetical protein RLZZ413_3108, partial [Pseudomonadota bacterium]